MSKAIFLPKGNMPMLQIVDFVDGLDWYHKMIECECITTAHPYALDGIDGLDNVDIICDDEGLFNAPVVNLMGSILYGAARHGQPIVGNCIITAHDDGGNDIGLTDDQVRKIAAFFAGK